MSHGGKGSGTKIAAPNTELPSCLSNERAHIKSWSRITHGSPKLLAHVSRAGIHGFFAGISMVTLVCHSHRLAWQLNELKGPLLFMPVSDALSSSASDMVIYPGSLQPACLCLEPIHATSEMGLSKSSSLAVCSTAYNDGLPPEVKLGEQWKGQWRMADRTSCQIESQKLWSPGGPMTAAGSGFIHPTIDMAKQQSFLVQCAEFLHEIEPV
ncbi:hypothetical protein EDC04DRAFT_2600233 [Pisolithus marmoratus]|nr:hypothetical protein EDC04DRAFT_2600233 [Pisolithus marmoratus]